MPLTRRPTLGATTAPSGSCPYVDSPIRTPPARRELLESRAGVDRVADQRIRDVTGATDLAHHRLAAVDADPQRRPLRVTPGRATASSSLQLERGARRPLRVVGLVAAAVEDRKHAVADELLDLTAEPARDQWRGPAPVGVQDGGDLVRVRSLGEAREVDEVAEEHADHLTALPGRRQVEVAEPLVPPLTADCQADDEVGRDDQSMPFPPARVPLPLARDRDADQRLGEQDEAGDDRGRAACSSGARYRWQ